MSLVYPVIMCGGSGTRLWPASRASRPKQFIPLVGERSSFQDTVLRVRDLGPLVVVAGIGHRALLAEQLAELGVDADVLLEPEPRDSAAAIAAACAWIEARDPDAVAVIVSADHHIPDAAAFRAAVAKTLAPARDGSIVTLGVRPSDASTAYGYIRAEPAAAEVKPVAAFVEKPDAERAAAYVAEGYLWNSGNFVAAARTLLEELAAHAPGVAEAARAGVAEAEADGKFLTLGRPFRAAPKTSIDYAVMEKTRRAAVLPVDFRWTDVGAWDAVWAASDKDADGNVLPQGAQAHASRDVLVRVTSGVHVAVVGVERLAVVAEPDAVLVCSLDNAQGVKNVAAGAPPAGFASLEEARRWFDLWLRASALPLWATVGVDPETGAFREGLTVEGEPYDPKRRARVQARQAFVMGEAAAAGLPGPWRAVAERGFERFFATGRRPDGLFVTEMRPDGTVSDEAGRLYEQAFVLLALATLGREADALALRGALEALRHPAGGYRELGEHPFQANAHMHLFEAALAWERTGSDPGWARLADQIANLALHHFVHPETGALREFFDPAWSPLTGEAGLVEPGHQFEWAWLLERWGRARGNGWAHEAACKLFEAGCRGVDPARDVAVNALWDDFSVRDPNARLWPQTERLKAALILGQEAEALSAARGLARYLDTPARGAWRDTMRADGSFVAGHAPATSFYHLMVAVQELLRT